MNVEYTIGDWIRLVRFYCEKEGIWKKGNTLPSKVFASTLESIISGEFEVEPVPLTKEILDLNWKNDEHKLNIDCDFMFRSDDYYLGVQLKPKTDCRKKISIYNYRTRRGLEYECSRPDDVETPFYVHELQHMLGQLKINFDIKVINL